MRILTIQEISTSEIPLIQDMAKRTWPSTFKDILTPEQIDYMLEMMYSEKALRKQIDVLGHRFFVTGKDGKMLGFISCETGCGNNNTTKIHKLYVVPEAQGRGAGRFLIDRARAVAREAGDRILSLNVNKFNPAVRFYEKIGFSTVAEEVIPIGKGYVMDDFVMEWAFSVE
ncbi:GNAT family N-acetyltransferase [Sinomicrobium soli]|uniref:GNAT family N-acetyltransferase n=1 Tax=Sinomicrobium sp. N-1-3-6 TaxID=2219864 RepID=UPI000DCBDAFD|nr:GNAT family N-acetyltransferase [Sinomicrobium sp. N-1-3-6]RAV29274.1 GNAT family N-acetyltransferase [Sinomicrobium sp. N-1-3-6]